MPHSTTGTAAATPAVSIRGDPDNTTSPWNADNNERPPRAAASAGTPTGGGLVIPKGKVAVWDETNRIMVIKNRDEVKLKTWKTRLRAAAFRFWAGGPPIG
eukprot:g16655.t1